MSTVPPGDRLPDPWHRRYWGYANQPYYGCGCLWAIALIVIIWWILAAFAIRPLRFGWW